MRRGIRLKVIGNSVVMVRLLSSFFLGAILLSCGKNKSIIETKSKGENDFKEIFDLYTIEEPELIYSQAVSDSFKLFKSLPDGYGADSSKYPLLLILDANAYFEAFVAEMKLARLTQGIPKSIIIGVGYKTFWAMDSLRDRDYTPLEYKDHSGFGGAKKFKSFC